MAYKRREAVIFEAIKTATVQDLIEVLGEVLPGQLDEKALKELTAKVGLVQGTADEETLINVDMTCQTVVEAYRELKKKVQVRLVEAGVARKDAAGYNEDYYDQGEYTKLVKKLGIEVEHLFEKCATMVKEEDRDEIVKKVCLESVISVALRGHINHLQ